MPGAGAPIPYGTEITRGDLFPRVVGSGFPWVTSGWGVLWYGTIGYVAKNRRPHQRRTKRRRAGTGVAARSGGAPGTGRAAAGTYPLRARVERASFPVVKRLHALPRWLVPLSMAALFGVGVIVRGWLGLACLAALLAFMVWITYLSWPVLRRDQRLIRLLVLGTLAGVVVTQTWNLP